MSEHELLEKILENQTPMQAELEEINKKLDSIFNKVGLHNSESRILCGTWIEIKKKIS